MWIKNNCKTTVTNYGFKGYYKITVTDISTTFKTIVTNLVLIKP